MLSCGGPGGTPHGTSPVTITMSVNSSPVSTVTPAQGAVPAAVAVVRITVEAPDMTTIVESVSVSGQGSVTITLEVPNGDNRHFIVECLDAGGAVIYRGETYADLDGTPVSLTVDMTLAADTTPPVFSGLQSATAVSEAEILLSWSPASDDVSAQSAIVYRIYISQTPGGEDFTSPDHTTAAGATSFTVTGLSPLTTYYFVVRAEDEAGNTDTNTVELQATTFPLITGVLDGTFGSGGIVVSDLLPSQYDPLEPTAVALQADGGIVVAGYATSISQGFDDMLLARYTPAGQLDTQFGTSGYVFLDLGGAQPTDDEIYDVAVQPDGKIVAVGYTDTSIMAVRFNTDGTLSTSSGAADIFTAAPSPGNDLLEAVAFQSDGSIIAVGTVDTYSDFLIVKIDPATWRLDTLFGSGTGMVVIDTSGIVRQDWAEAVAVRPDDYILVGGFASNGTDDDIVIVRLDPQGNIDPTFGTNGKVVIDLGGDEYLEDLVLQPDGRLVGAGSTNDWSAGIYRSVLFRLNADGSKDTGFGTGGVVSMDLFPSAFDSFGAVALQADGRIVAAGDTAPTDSLAYTGFLLRFDTSGAIDPSFGTSGMVTVPQVGTNVSNSIYDIAIQPADGKIVAAGSTGDGYSNDIMVLRYQ